VIVIERFEFNAFSSDIHYASRRSNYTPLPIEFKASNTINEEYQDTISKQNYSHTDEPLTQKLSNIQSVTRSIISQETKSKQSSIESHSTSKSPSNISTKTGKSSISTLPTQNQSLSGIKHITTPSTNSNLSTKLAEVDHMSTVYEESEPSSISIPHAITSSLHKRGIPSFSDAPNLFFDLFRY
jgi:hypothetical protein